MNGVSVIVPTIDEAGNIESLIDAIAEVMTGRFDYEVLVVDDGSTDGTRELVLAREANEPVRLVARDAPSGGLTGAVVEGARNARFETVVIIDGDLSHPPSVIPDLAAPVIEGEKDVMVGSRHVPGGGMPGWPWRRRFVSKVAAALAWPIVDVRDPMSGFLALRRDRLVAVDPAAKGFKVGLEVMAGGGGQPRVGEAPIVFRDREAGQSKMKTSTIIAYLVRLAALAGAHVERGPAVALVWTAVVSYVVDVLGIAAVLASGGSHLFAHLAGGIGAAVVAYLFASRTVPATSVAGMRRVWRGFTVMVLALALRAGLFAYSPGLAWTILTASPIFAGALYVGNAFYVFSRPSRFDRRVLRWRVAAVGVAAYALLLHVVYLALPALMPEEAYYWNYAQHLDLSYLDHPPLVSWLIWVSTAVFGENEMGVRVPALLCWMVAVVYVYRLGCALFDKSAGIIAAALATALPFFSSAGFFMTPDAPLLACWAAMLWYCHRALFEGRARAWVGVGAALGIGMLAKYSIVLLVPALWLFMVLDKDARQWWRRPQPYLAGAISVLLFAPVLVWNARHDWISFAFQTTRRIEETSEFSLHVLLIASLLIVTPPGLVAAFVGMRRPVADGARPPREPRRRRFLAVFTLVPLAVFVWFSFTKESKANWTLPVWLGALPMVGAALIYSWSEARAVLMSRRWAATLTAFVIGLGLLLQYIVIGVPGVPFRADIRVPTGWRELSRQVDEARGDATVVVGMNKYFLTSELAFYLRDRDDLTIASRSLLGKTSLMWEFWDDPEACAGRTCLLVSFDLAGVTRPYVDGYFERLDAPVKHEIERDGVWLAGFYTRMAYGYRPPD
ncbi:MAG: glycosyltransferase family 39 protein [Planctomycetota bacterium]